MVFNGTMVTILNTSLWPRLSCSNLHSCIYIFKAAVFITELEHIIAMAIFSKRAILRGREYWLLLRPYCRRSSKETQDGILRKCLLKIKVCLKYNVIYLGIL